MSQAYPNRQNTHSLAIISLVLSILGLMPVCLWLVRLAVSLRE
jgi:hypothetical protein